MPRTFAPHCPVFLSLPLLRGLPCACMARVERRRHPAPLAYRPRRLPVILLDSCLGKSPLWAIPQLAFLDGQDPYLADQCVGSSESCGRQRSILPQLCVRTKGCRVVRPALPKTAQSMGNDLTGADMNMRALVLRRRGRAEADKNGMRDDDQAIEYLCLKVGRECVQAGLSYLRDLKEEWV
ncbi:hypothetical protein B0H10DRAFT_694053 [Mycena sp. CBHHK59/15]|nr:hypothetical protein B0H10DRAFT_694053 [Mycena sp. CBHHK59/15]